MTIHSLKLSRHRRGRVWLGEPPDASYSPTRSLRRVVSSGLAIRPAIRIAGIELVVPRGGMASYGLLGAELLDSERGDGEVNVNVAVSNVPMHGSLAVMPDRVWVGLPDEYANAVISGVEIVVREGWR